MENKTKICFITKDGTFPKSALKRLTKELTERLKPIYGLNVEIEVKKLGVLPKIKGEYLDVDWYMQKVSPIATGTFNVYIIDQKDWLRRGGRKTLNGYYLRETKTPNKMMDTYVVANRSRDKTIGHEIMHAVSRDLGLIPYGGILFKYCYDLTHHFYAENRIDEGWNYLYGIWKKQSQKKQTLIDKIKKLLSLFKKV